MAYIRASSLGSVGLTMPGQTTAVLRVEGVPAAIAKLRLVGAIAGREVGLVVRHSAVDIVDRAREIVHSSSNPWKSDYQYTDALKNGIQLTGEGGRAGGLGTYTQSVTASSRAGGSDREYAQYEENGTSRAPAHPYLRPAANEQVPKTVVMLKALALQLERI
jgi:hypothetical protein